MRKQVNQEWLHRNLHENLFELRADLKERRVMARTRVIIEIRACCSDCTHSRQTSHSCRNLTLHSMELFDKDRVEGI